MFCFVLFSVELCPRGEIGQCCTNPVVFLSCFRATLLGVASSDLSRFGAAAPVFWDGMRSCHRRCCLDEQRRPATKFGDSPYNGGQP